MTSTLDTPVCAGDAEPITRLGRHLSHAYERGIEDAALELVWLIDELDRMIEELDRREANHHVRHQLREMRTRSIEQFHRLGYSPYALAGDVFDPKLHQVTAVVEAAVAEPTVTTVHRRGWKHGRIVIRPALVTVRRPARIVPPPSLREMLGLEKHDCLYHIETCRGDCPGCEYDRTHRSVL